MTVARWRLYADHSVTMSVHGRLLIAVQAYPVVLVVSRQLISGCNCRRMKR